MSSDDLFSIPVKDYASEGIKLRVTCRTCGRQRVIEGGLLPRHFTPEDRLNQYRVNQFAKRLRCGDCDSPWPRAELGKWGEP